MPSIYVISQYVAYQNSVRLVEFMPFTTAFHPSLYNSCLIVNPWARLMLIIVKTMFIERKKKQTISISLVHPSGDEPSLCRTDFHTVHVNRINSFFLKKKKKKKETNSDNKHLVNIRNRVISVFRSHPPRHHLRVCRCESQIFLHKKTP